MLVDMHLHECTYSTDSFLHLEEIVSIARQKGLDAICITDHDSMGLRERAEAYSREIGYPIFVGVEFFSLWGDITAWGIGSAKTRKKQDSPVFEKIKLITRKETTTMKLRTFTALLLAAIMLFALTACGSQAADDSSSDQQQEQQDTTTNESNEFRVGMECAYAPNNWQESEATDSNVPVENVAGTYAEGYDVQIAKAIAEGLGKELVIVKLSWDGLIDALNQGQIDAIIAGMMDTAERRESINFSEPYRETTYGLMVLADSPYLNATSIQDFSGAAVLGQQGTALDDVIEQIEGVDHLSPVGSVPDMISRLQQGTCDAIVINVENAQGYLASNPNFRLVTFDEGSGFTLPAKGSCVGLRKSDNELLDQINTILSGIDDDARAAMWQAAVDGQPQ